MRPGRQQGRRHSVALAWLAGIALAVVACGRSDEPPPVDASACYAALAGAGARFEIVDEVGSGSCAVPAPVRLSGLEQAALEPPVVTSCPLALTLARFEADALQPLARAELGRPVATVQTFGSHSCRRMTGNRGRYSLHATGLAIDVSGFRLADGRVVTVAKGWRGRRGDTDFLRATAAAACRRFSMTLTPESDRAHQDHLHLDIGPWRGCGA